MAKSTRQPDKPNPTRASKPFELLHTDLIGPFKTRSLNGARLAVSYLDDATGYGEVFPVSKKSDALVTLKLFRARVLKHFKADIGTIRSDNAKELIDGQYRDYCTENHIVLEPVAAYAPATNGRIERYHGTVERMAMAMLFDSGLPNALWAETLKAAAFIRNRLYHTATRCIPYLKLYKHLPAYHRLRAFGCRVWSNIDNNKRAKFDPVADRGILVGYDSKAYRIYLPHKHKIIRRRHARFDETLMPARDLQSSPHPDDAAPSNARHTASDDDFPLPESIPRRSNRIRHRPTYLQDYTLFASADAFASAAATDVMTPLPNTLEEALAIPDEADQWLAAARSEYNSLMKRGVWSVVRLPPGRKAIRSRWSFRRKIGDDNIIYRFKARFCAKGFTQRQGIDYSEVFAPVARWDALRTLIAIAAALKIQLYQLDVDTAFLYADLDEVIYMDQPPGFEEAEKDPRLYKCLLHKSIYGLKQSSRQFNHHLDRRLRSLGFQPTAADPCVYLRPQDGVTTIAACYVDDIIYGSTSEAARKEFYDRLSKEYDLKDLGYLQNALGVQVERADNGSYSIHQSAYISRLLAKFDMADARPIDTPAACPPLTIRLRSEPRCSRPDLYRSLVGALLYALHTRPDCTFSVSQLAKFMNDPSESHWRAAKRVLRYLKGTQDLRLHYSADASVIELDASADSDWASCTDSRKSVSGTIVRVNGTPVHWRSFRQPIVAHSSTEAELIALDLVAREVLWHRLLLSNLGFPQCDPTIIFQDNQSTIKFSNNPTYSQRTKHIDVRYHCIRNWITDGTVKLQYQSTLEMIADGLTKALGSNKFKLFVERLCLLPPPL